MQTSRHEAPHKRRTGMRTLSALSAIALATALACSLEPTNDDEEIRQVTQQVSTTSKVLVNLLGYLPDAEKVAVVVSAGSSGTWQIIDSNGNAVAGASGSTTVQTSDINSGEAVHHADFSSFKAPGQGYKLRVTIGGTAHQSESFDIHANLYANKKLPQAIMKVVHYARAGMATAAFPEFNVAAHGAGHTNDDSLGAHGTWCSGCSFDVDGGWYDAGDNGKYMESHTAATWYFLNSWERMKDETDSSGTKLSNWDIGNDVTGESSSIPEFIHEMVWGTRWVAGAMNDPFTAKATPTRADLVSNKCTSASWPAYPVAYTQDVTSRACMGPSTSATYSAVRNLAHMARILKDYGSTSTLVTVDGQSSASGVAGKFWDVAQEAYSRAVGAGASDLSSSDLSFASSESPGHNVGSGPYQDDDMADDEYAAAVEAYLTACAYSDATAVAYYKNIVENHSYYKTVPHVPDWGTEGGLGDNDGEEAAMGTLSLIFGHDTYCTDSSYKLPSSDLTSMKANLESLADDLITNMNGQNFPYAPAGDGGQIVWGSNSAQAGSAAILAAAYQTSGDKNYLKAAYRAFDYLLGTNPMRTSYITGFGIKSGECCAVNAVHHRSYNAGGQGVPRGVIVGGPLNVNGDDPSISGDSNNLNPSQKDNVTPKSGPGLKRFANTTGDGGSSWESEEKAINWDAAAFAGSWALQVFSDDILATCSTSADCDDGSACTTDTCSSGVCSNTPMNCSDGDSCTQDSCVEGSCVNVNTCCSSGSDCDDGDSCTDNVCSSGACSNPLNGSCVAGDVVPLIKSGTDTADNTIHVHLKVKNNGSSSINLSDYEVRYYFTNDSTGSMADHCDWASNGCSSITRSFEATNAGEGADTYVKLTFASQTIAAGSDSGEMQIRLTASNWSNFNEADDHSFQASSSSFTENNNVGIFQAGTRVYGVLPGEGDGGSSGCTSNSDCDDNNACTTDTCNSDGTCSQSTPSCDDGNPCTTDSCDPAVGCTTTNNNLGCTDDNNSCTADICNGGSCTHPDNGTCTGGCTSNSQCDDSDACTVDTCNVGTGVCSNDTLDCNDGNSCTSDSCNPSTGCVNTSLSTGAPCADDGDVCTTDVCDGSGSCTHPDSGVCECNTNADCDDSDSCTDDACSGHLCSHTPNSSCSGGTGGGGGGGGGPCDGICGPATTHTSQSFTSGSLGTAEVCQEFVGTLYGANCGNMSGRTFSVNGAVQTCSGNFTPPAQVNGGYCFHAAAGGVGWAWYGHW